MDTSSRNRSPVSGMWPVTDVHKCPMIAHYRVSTAIHVPLTQALATRALPGASLTSYKDSNQFQQKIWCKMSWRQKKSIYCWNLTPVTPWQQVMDDHDEWNPDIQKLWTKILSEWSKNRVGSIASSYNALLSETTVYPGQQPNNSQGSYLRYLPWDKSYPASRSIFKKIEFKSTNV